MEEVITRQNKSCELTFVFGLGELWEMCNSHESSCRKALFHDANSDIKSPTKEVFKQTKLNSALPAAVVRTEEHSGLFARTEAQQAEGNRELLHSPLPSTACDLFCMLYFWVSRGSFTAVVIPWQM